ncbi:hypothetical protein PMIN05_006796 [Paraphaeosphaeria minitans]
MQSERKEKPCHERTLICRHLFYNSSHNHSHIVKCGFQYHLPQYFLPYKGNQVFNSARIKSSASHSDLSTILKSIYDFGPTSRMGKTAVGFAERIGPNSAATPSRSFV